LIAGMVPAGARSITWQVIVADVLISSLVFWVVITARRPAGPTPWPFIVLNCSIGLSCALPAYLYVCARRESAVAGAVPAPG
jgi:hypothetical protein